MRAHRLESLCHMKSSGFDSGAVDQQDRDVVLHGVDTLAAGAFQGVFIGADRKR